ncbi:hypothetical protein M011DRAFT_231040 [Sporormia fimetaria CBS 119925]|uniref:Uncharacterized protein n=1 Tax=Sporormia fimetaria CBS 119925 TaxID=1340428 RepID=A0A6A6VK73_9PLEO|nr:hypothetical protein M011DRAFT_231040 [Sporormia fimetaria CBS 119925]
MKHLEILERAMSYDKENERLRIENAELKRKVERSDYPFFQSSENRIQRLISENESLKRDLEQSERKMKYLHGPEDCSHQEKVVEPLMARLTIACTKADEYRIDRERLRFQLQASEREKEDLLGNHTKAYRTCYQQQMALEGQLDNLKKEKETLEGQLDDLKKEKETLKGDVSRLREEKEKIERETPLDSSRWQIMIQQAIDHSGDSIELLKGEFQRHTRHWNLFKADEEHVLDVYRERALRAELETLADKCNNQETLDLIKSKMRQRSAICRRIELYLELMG